MDQKEKFSEMKAKLGEFFDDYLLIVRANDGMWWRASDESWGIGAAKRYISHVADQDRAELYMKIQKEREQ